MTKAKSKSVIKYVKALLPALLVAILVADAICAYKHPDLSKYSSPVADKAVAAAVKKPKLKVRAQKEKEKKEPEGNGGTLGKAAETGEYRDGEYKGSARGFGGKITVKVTIKNGKIARVVILSAPGEDAAYFNKAKKLMGVIVKKNSTNVDAVSGATYSSNGIIMAVRNALAKAAVSKKTKKKNSGCKSIKKRKEQKKEPAKKPEAISASEWKDGRYTGKGEGFGGTLEVIVVIEKGKISSINVGKNSEDAKYLEKAKGPVISAIIKRQGTGVDTVSGATYSSVGIIEAVNDALRKAAVKRTSTTDNEDRPQDEQSTEPAPAEDTGDDPDDSVVITKTVKIYCDEYEDFEDYDLQMTFRIENGKVKDIQDVRQVVANAGNDRFIKAAVAGIKSQLSAKPDLQGMDTVSGATCTSQGIISGGQSALHEAAGR